MSISLAFRAFVLFLILIIGRWAWFTEPLGISVDESTYLSLANILENGGVLYRDAVDRKPPALIWLYQLSGNLFGFYNLDGVHFLYFLILLGCLWILWRALRDLDFSNEVAWFGMLIFALASSSFPREVISANAEYPMLLMMGLSCALFVRWTQKPEDAFLCELAALFFALGILFKQYAVLLGLGAYISWLIFAPKRSTAHIIRSFLIFLTIPVLVLSAVYVVFWWKGAHEVFVRYFLFDGLQYVATSRETVNHQTSAWVAIGGILASWPSLWVASTLGLFKTQNMRLKIWMGFALGALATCFLSGRYYTHYFVPLIWSLSLLATPVLCRIPEVFQVRKLRWLNPALWTLLIISFSFYAWFNVERERISQSWSFTRAKQHDIEVLGAWIEQNSRPQDEIVVWGMASQIYTTSKRRSGTRFVFSDFVAGRQPGLKSSESRPTLGALPEFIRDLHESRPLYFIDTSTAALNDYQWFPPSRFAALDLYLRRNYMKVAHVQGFDVWKLRRNL